MRLDFLFRVVSRHPEWVVGGWIIVTAAVFFSAPDLTTLAAKEQADLLPKNSESVRMAKIVAKAWPDQSYQSMAVVALERTGGLSDKDLAYGRALADAFGPSPKRPPAILRIMGPGSIPEVASRMISPNKAMELVAVPLSESFVSPVAHVAIAWLQAQAKTVDNMRPSGLDVVWTGDASIGRDYMADVGASLDRAALLTIVLLLGVLMVVYRSLPLALIPLATIGVSLVVSRAVLAWLVLAGWEVSPLVELFLVVVLFGSGTDFGLFLAWRFGEDWKQTDPQTAMIETLELTSGALLTSAGTVIAGLSLMGTTQFKLFSSTGPSVAIGLALTLLATLTLTPSLLVLLARHRPRSFHAMTGAPSEFWDWIGRAVLAKPLTTWLLSLAIMVPPAAIGLRTKFIQDTLSEMPPSTQSVQALDRVITNFGQGYLTPLTVVLQANAPDIDLRQSSGLALIDDASRFLSQNRRLKEVRSATQPLGSTELLDPARLSSRLRQVNDGFDRMASGANQLHDGLLKGAAKIRLAMMFQSYIGGFGGTKATPANQPSEKLNAAPPASTPNPLSALTNTTGAALERTRDHVENSTTKDPNPPADPRQALMSELGRAADGAGQIAAGALRAGEEVSEILEDPVGRHALNRLLITPRTVNEHPDLRKGFDAYISPDGKNARLDVIQDERMSSESAMDQVVNLRRRLGEYLAESEWLHVTAGFTGSNADSADIRSLTRRDQYQTWLIVPSGVFLILMIALRDPWACLNLVATMLLTYAFALGITHLVFIDLLGDVGLDWKVPYFLFVLLVAVGVDYNVFLMSRLKEEVKLLGTKQGIERSVARTGSLITSAASITACSFASLLLSPLSSLRQLGFALVVGITIDALLVRPILVPCGHWLMKRRSDQDRAVSISAVPILDTPHLMSQRAKS